ncbi:MAG: hypothetical protein OET79_09165 [Nitrospirota bacterium]|nr:hypothetical protein [Nitrospirota bacterium]
MKGQAGSLGATWMRCVLVVPTKDLWAGDLSMPADGRQRDSLSLSYVRSQENLLQALEEANDSV